MHAITLPRGPSNHGRRYQRSSGVTRLSQVSATRRRGVHPRRRCRISAAPYARRSRVVISLPIPSFGTEGRRPVRCRWPESFPFSVVGRIVPIHITLWPIPTTSWIWKATAAVVVAADDCHMVSLRAGARGWLFVGAAARPTAGSIGIGRQPRTRGSALDAAGLSESRSRRAAQARGSSTPGDCFRSH